VFKKVIMTSGKCNIYITNFTLWDYISNNIPSLVNKTLEISYIITTVCLSVRPGADLGFRTSTNGQGDRAGAGQGGQAKRPGKFFKTWFSGLGISTLGPGKF